jgi:hypothetical protein
MLLQHRILADHTTVHQILGAPTMVQFFGMVKDYSEKYLAMHLMSSTMAAARVVASSYRLLIHG